METKKCVISNKNLSLNELVEGKNIRKPLFDLIQKDYPNIKEIDFVSSQELNKYRKQYLENMLTEEMGELSGIEKQVVESIHKHELISENIETEMVGSLTIGQRLADQIAEFGGSWTFIILFFSFILVWMLMNLILLTQKPFDPYPFILLNLVLSCLAAIQAPIIMMSQNRKEARDRKRSEHDYKINLKAELEIRLLHEKIDHLLLQQNQRLVEIQQMQIDLLENILEKVSAKG